MIPNKTKINHKINSRMVEKSVKGQLVNDRPISKVIKAFTDSNLAENKKRFNIGAFTKELEKTLSEDRAAVVTNRAIRPYEGKVASSTSPTAQDIGREERKLLKKRMRSRR